MVAPEMGPFFSDPAIRGYVDFQTSCV